MDGLVSAQPLRIVIVRVSPKIYRGENIEGVLNTVDHAFTESDVQEWYGGGKYALKIQRQNDQGSWVHFKTRTIIVSGRPKLQHDDQESNGANGNNNEPASVVNNVMRLLEGNNREMLDRADRQNNAQNPQMDMMMEELRQAREQNANMQRQMFSTQNNGATEQLLGQVINGDAQRSESLRAQFEAERRAQQDHHARQLEMAANSHQEQLRRQDDAQRREIDSVRQSYQMQIDTLKLSYDGQIQGLNRELTAAQTELITLRAKKDKTFVEQIAEIKVVQETLGEFAGVEKEPSTIEKIAAAVGGPLMERVMGGGPMAMAGAATAAVAPNPVDPAIDPSIPVNKPIELPDGRTVVQRRDGRIQEIRTRGVHSVNTNGEPVVLSDEDLLAAEAFLGQAMQTGNQAEAMAGTVKTMFPGHAEKIRQIAATEGVDALLIRVAKLRPESLLLSADGKAWFEQVAAALG